MKRKILIVGLATMLLLAGATSTYLILNGKSNEVVPVSIGLKNPKLDEHIAVMKEKQKFNEAIKIETNLNISATTNLGNSYESIRPKIVVTKPEIESVLNFGSLPNYDKSFFSISYDSDIFAPIPRGGGPNIEIDNKILTEFPIPAAKYVTYVPEKFNDRYHKLSLQDFWEINQSFKFDYPEIATKSFWSNEEDIQKFNQKTNNGKVIDYSSFKMQLSFYYDNNSRVVNYYIDLSEDGNRYNYHVELN
jgi:hypothetical protein